MTRRMVLEEAVSFVVGFVAGLLTILAWPGGGLLPGIVAALAAGLVFDWIVYRRGPRLRIRPWRYSIPATVAIFASIVLATTDALREPNVALTAYVVCLPLLATGVVASDWLWASAPDRDETARPQQ